MPKNIEQLEEVVRKVSEGINVDGVRACAKNVCRCGLKGVLAFDICLQYGLEEEQLLCMAVFPGKKPHYRPWAELFCIRGSLRSVKDYYGSAVEDAVLRLFSNSLGPGGKIYIEYYSDRETSCGLAMGFPPQVTRQGYKLFTLGFTWFKDWYFSEGGHEGGQKLQGERPLDEAAKRRQLQRIKAEVEDFLKISSDLQEEDDMQEYLPRARERAKDILNEILN
jgi:hypothetical protein